VVTALIPLTILFFIFPRDTLSGVVMLFTAPLIPAFMILIGKGAEAVTRRQYLTLSRLSAHFLDTLQGLTTLKLLGRSKDYTRTIAEVSDQYRHATLRVLRLTFLSAFALELLATISVAIIAVEIGLRLLYAKMLFQSAFFILILAPEFYLPFRLLGLRFHAGMDGVTAARRIFAILDYANFDVDKANAIVKFAIRKIECPLAEDFINRDTEAMLAAHGFGDFEKSLYFKGFLRLLKGRKG